MKILILTFSNNDWPSVQPVLSQAVDPVIGCSVGKTIIGIWKKASAE